MQRALIPWRLHGCRYRVHEFPQVYFTCLFRFSHHDIELPCSYIPSSLSSTGLVVDLCLWFHQILDEGSMMTGGVFTSLIQGRTFRHSLQYCGSHLGLSLWITGNFPSTRILPNCNLSRYLFHSSPAPSLPPTRQSCSLMLSSPAPSLYCPSVTPVYPVNII